MALLVKLMLSTFKDHKILGLFKAMLYLYCVLGRLKTLAYLRAFFPKFSVKCLGEGKNSIILNSAASVDADDVVGPRILKYLSGELRVTRSHENKVQSYSAFVDHFFEIICIEVLA